MEYQNGIEKLLVYVEIMLKYIINYIYILNYRVQKN